MKVLVSAYSCDPGKGSEPGAGWEWARAAALRHDVWLLTRTQNFKVLDEVLASEPELRITPVYLDLPEWMSWLKKGQRGVHLYYLLWQLLAWREAKRLHEMIGFDLTHHVTFATDWMPAGVCWIDVPSVWGPVGGSSTPTPWALWKWLGLRGLASEAARSVITPLGRRVFGYATARRSAVVLAQNQDVERRFRWHSDVRIEPHISLSQLASVVDSQTCNPGLQKKRSAVFAGRLLSWKGVRLAVAAVAADRSENWELHIYGAGPDEAPCRGLAADLGVSDRVHFHGWRPRSQVLEAVTRADALLFPSMHDAGGWIVAEAVAVGTPVVCLDRGGPAVLANGPGNIRVEVSPTVVADLAMALESVGSGSRPLGSDRWDAERLPGLLDDLYTRLVQEGKRVQPAEHVGPFDAPQPQEASENGSSSEPAAPDVPQSLSSATDSQPPEDGS